MVSGNGKTYLVEVSCASLSHSHHHMCILISMSAIFG